MGDIRMTGPAGLLASAMDDPKAESAESRPAARLLSLVGAPSPRLHAALGVVKSLAKVSLGGFDVVSANSLPDLKSKLPAGPNRRSVLLYCDYPQRDVLAALAEIKAPVAICVDDFVTMAHYSVVWRGYGGVDAARFATMGLVNIEPLIAAPPESSLIIDDSGLPLFELIVRLAGLFRIPADPPTVSRVLADLGVADRGAITLGEFAAKTTASYAGAREILERRGPLENELIDFLGEQYAGIASGRRLETVEWPPFSLLRPDYPDRLTVGPIDLTGPARFIYYGPYFALPSGAWSADIALEVQDCLSDNHIAIDIYAGELLAVVRAKLPPEGVYGCQIRFEIEDPSKPVEIRLQLLTGAIEGVLQLHAIALRRLRSLDEPEPAAFAEEEAG